MSAFLGPIHFWLYEKIGNQEALTKAVADRAASEGWISAPERYTKTLPPLEEVIDENNIHGWLQAQITDAETRYAGMVDEILAKDAGRMDILCAAAFAFGKERALRVENAPDAYQAFEDFFVNGMPCDRVNALTRNDPDKVAWEMTQDIHAPYWNGDSSPYYTLRKQVMYGMLSASSLAVQMPDTAHYTIVRK